MLIFETILLLLLAAALLSMLARRLGVPYPTLLALGGVVLALLPGSPSLSLPPDLILALFVAPILLDAAHDASLRDLKRDWRAVLSLVVVAVGLTTVAVALTARWLLPGMPWAAAVALGALVAPPDAVAALAVMRQVAPPHRIRTVLEGESLLNDASALLIYRLAVAAVATGSFSLTGAVPAFLLVVLGSIAVGWTLAQIMVRLNARISDAPTATIIQFVGTFGVWLLAERLDLSGVVTIVVFGMTAGRRPSQSDAVQVRVTSFATWESVTFVLNVLAFTLIGLQLRPVLGTFAAPGHGDWLIAAAAVLAVVIAVRLAWALLYGLAGVPDRPAGQAAEARHPLKGALVVGWAGMRGIVTVAAALALPPDFPYRAFILLAAFTVVLGTLVIQGLTLRPLLVLLRLPQDDPTEAELALARAAALKAVLEALDGSEDPSAAKLKREYQAKLALAHDGINPRQSPVGRLRQQVVPHARRALVDLRRRGHIGDEAYRRVEQELDWLELSLRP